MRKLQQKLLTKIKRKFLFSFVALIVFGAVLGFVIVFSVVQRSFKANLVTKIRGLFSLFFYGLC